MTRWTVRLAVVALLVVGTHAVAAPIMLTPDANFTLRSTTNAGPAIAIDSTWGGLGFDGFLTNSVVFSQFDRTYLEFDLSGIPGVTSASLDFQIVGLASDTVTVETYAGNGIAELADWSVATSSFTTFAPASGSVSLDVTSVMAANLGSPSHLSFAFSMAPLPGQAFMGTDRPVLVINYVVPEPATMTLMVVGLGIGAWRRRRRRR